MTHNSYSMRTILTVHRCAIFVAALLLTGAAAGPLAQTPAAPARVELTPAHMEAFLLTAKVIAKKNTAKGVTKPIQATLSDGTLTHEAQIQAVNESRSLFEAGKATEVGFKDSYKFNVAGYRLAQRLGLQHVPMSVKRKIDRDDAAVTWWVDDVAMDETGRLKSGTPPEHAERVAKQTHVMRVWDELIQNRDRNQGNMLWATDWTLWMIDHTRAFRTDGQLRKPDLLMRCDRALLDALRRLTPEDMAYVASDGMLTKDEAAAVLKRRDRIVKHFEDRIAARGETAVLFAM